VAEAHPIGPIVDGRYRIEERIGAGGMGEVYRARQLNVDRDIALKVLPRDRAQDERAVERFLVETKAVSRLTSPHTVTLYDAGRLDDGSPFLAMELLSGTTLRDALAKRGCALDEAIRIVDGVALALVEAHARGIVHGDIKPSNVFLADTPGHVAQAKVLDFGLARLGDAPGPRRAAGTLRYMAPEVLRGEAADPRADVYALGMLAYEVLGGQHPFAALDRQALIDAQLTVVPPPVAEASDHDLPKAVTKLLARALAKPARLRPPDAGAFRRAFLDAFEIPSESDPDRSNERDAGAAALPSETAVSQAPLSPEANAGSDGVEGPRRSPGAAPDDGRSPPWSRPSQLGVAGLLALLLGGAWWGWSRQVDGPSTPAATGSDGSPSASASSVGDSAEDSTGPTEPAASAMASASATPLHPVARSTSTSDARPAVATADPPKSATPTTPEPVALAASGEPVLQDGFCRYLCKSNGRCKRLGAGGPNKACKAVAASDCATSDVCRKYGDCFLGNGRCVPSEQSCRDAGLCKRDGACTLVGDACRARSSADCATSAVCRSWGHCTYDAAKAKCAATSTADCQAGDSCKNGGACIFQAGRCEWGGSNAACQRSNGCRKGGYCQWTGARCVAKSIADCANISPSASWVLVDGTCKTK
jgi:eukaryotic-like serine/threonine-protein kinase